MSLFSDIYCQDVPTVLKDNFLKVIETSNPEGNSEIDFNLFYTIYSMPNILLPIFGGVIVDRFGSRLSLILFINFIIIG